ncbi:PASTA domain-containing protein [Adhaeribacter rhizoryzae]|nr:PASTA domain-containing protein [Adhaeribacter rhizoryzae]
MFFKADSLGDVIKHIAVIIIIVALMLFFFFFVYLPSTTNHGETITVPKVEGMKLNEIEDFLAEHSLQYYVSDSSYSSTKEPFTVTKQDPQPGAKVKEDRKIYITYNMKTAPMIKMPKLVDLSLKNAQMILKTSDLQVGKIEFVPDLAQNAVLKQLLKGKEIAAGDLIPKGSSVDLVVGDGLGNAEFQVPNVVGMPADEATTLLVGAGLQMGAVQYIAAPNGEPEGTVVRQRPISTPGAKIRVGELVDIWVVGANPAPAIE